MYPRNVYEEGGSLSMSVNLRAELPKNRFGQYQITKSTFQVRDYLSMKMIYHQNNHT